MLKVAISLMRRHTSVTAAGCTRSFSGTNRERREKRTVVADESEERHHVIVERHLARLKLQLDDGMGGRQVVSGIAQWYKPEDLIGKKIILVANLKPAKLCGVESNGMICAADAPDGSASVVFPDQSLPCGAKIR